MKTILNFGFRVLVATALCTGLSDVNAFAENPEPVQYIQKLESIGLKAYIPWRKSKVEGWVAILKKRWDGPANDQTLDNSLAKRDSLPPENEVNCQVLGPDEHTIGLLIAEAEIRYETDARKTLMLGLDVLRQIDPTCPRDVLKAFARRQTVDFGRWNIRTDAVDTEVSVTATFHPTKSLTLKQWNEVPTPVVRLRSNSENKPKATEEPFASPAVQDLSVIAFDGKVLSVNKRAIKHPFLFTQVVDALGPPDRTASKANLVHTWDRYGIVAYQKTIADPINAFRIVFRNDTNEFAPAKTFQGVIRINKSQFNRSSSPRELLSAGFAQNELLNYYFTNHLDGVSLIAKYENGLQNIEIGN